MGVYGFNDYHRVSLGRENIDSLLWELNKALRKKMRKLPSSFKANLYMVGGACAIVRMGNRASTLDIDAVWDIGSEMRDCINEVGDKFGLGHTWCNCDFKRTTSYTTAIFTNSDVYKSMDRLVVWTVKPELLLAMKLMAFRDTKMSDVEDIKAVLQVLQSKGVKLSSDYAYYVLRKYYGNPRLNSSAINFIRGLDML